MRARCGTLKNHWYVAAQSGQVRGKRPVSSTILETRLALYRRRDGVAVALHDRCPHRNQFLSEGWVRGDDLQCAYHGWTFDGAGRCVNVPSEGPCGRAFDGREVESFPVCEQDGLVWVWMGGEVSPCAGERPPSVPAVGSGWGGFILENNFENSVGSCVENFIDVPHTVWAHAGWFRTRQGLKVSATVERDAQGVLVTYHAQGDALGWGDRLFNPRGLPLAHTDRFIMPSTTRVDYDWGQGASGMVIMSANVPVRPFLTRTYTAVRFKRGVFNPLFRTLLPWYAQAIIDQDKAQLALQGRSVQEAPANYKHTPADAQHLLVGAMRAWAEEGGQGEPPRPVKRDVEFWI